MQNDNRQILWALIFKMLTCSLGRGISSVKFFVVHLWSSGNSKLCEQEENNDDWLGVGEILARFGQIPYRKQHDN